MHAEDLPLIHSPYLSHHGNERAYIRDFILGVDDGMISTTLLATGVYASGMTSENIVLSIFSSALGGSISMALGEYLATKSQKEVTDAELELEKLHILYHLKEELRLVEDFLRDTLLITDKKLINDFVQNMKKNPNGLFHFMKSVEFGISEDDNRSPLVAMAVSGGLFLTGSTPSMISFLLPIEKDTCFIVCCIFNMISLFAVGTLKTRITKTNVCKSGFENLGLATFGGIVSYTIGYLFSFLIRQ